MLSLYYFYWFRIDIKHMIEPWLDQALMDSAYRSDSHQWYPEYLWTCSIRIWESPEQGVRNRRYRYNWRGSPYHMIIHALQTPCYCIRSKCTSDKYFLFKWSTRLQSMYNHMVGRTASVIFPFYSLLPGPELLWKAAVGSDDVQALIWCSDETVQTSE